MHVRKYRAKTGAVLASFFIRLVYVVRRYRVTVVSLALEASKQLVGLELGKEKKEINPWGSFASARPSEEYQLCPVGRLQPAPHCTALQPVNLGAPLTAPTSSDSQFWPSVLCACVSRVVLPFEIRALT